MARRPNRKRQIQEALEKAFGPHSDALIQQLKKIAMGETIWVNLENGMKKPLTPTISEIQTACLDLLAYQHGRPAQSLDVDVTSDRPKWNPDALSLEELQQIDALARKASAPKLIEGNFRVEGDVQNAKKVT